MKLYGGIDLHSNNNVIALLGEKDQVVYQRRLGNDLSYVLSELAPLQGSDPGTGSRVHIQLVLGW